jgi:hypothetical protein
VLGQASQASQASHSSHPHPLAPPTRPASNYPQRWWLVLAHGGCLVAVPPPRRCSPLPPREQLLAAAGAAEGHGVGEPVVAGRKWGGVGVWRWRRPLG